MEKVIELLDEHHLVYIVLTDEEAQEAAKCIYSKNTFDLLLKSVLEKENKIAHQTRELLSKTLAEFVIVAQDYDLLIHQLLSKYFTPKQIAYILANAHKYKLYLDAIEKVLLVQCKKEAF